MGNLLWQITSKTIQQSIRDVTDFEKMEKSKQNKQNKQHNNPKRV